MILCGRSSNRTRAFSPRPLPTDRDYAASTGECQSDSTVATATCAVIPS